MGSLEALGVCTIDAGSENQIADLAGLYAGLNKQVFAICDKQTDANKVLIEAQVDTLFMHQEKGFENLVLKNTTKAALDRFADLIEWPAHLTVKYQPDLKAQVADALSDYFGYAKGNWAVADFLAQCSEEEIPEWIRTACIALKGICGGQTAPADDSGKATATLSAAAV